MAFKWGFSLNDKSFFNFRDKLDKQTVIFPTPKPGYYHVLWDSIVQVSSGRYYSRFIYNGFQAERLISVTNCCNSESFQTYVRLYSYTCHLMCVNMPIFQFFDYSFCYSCRNLTSIELDIFRICRDGDLREGSIVVQDLNEFMINLNDRFFFSTNEVVFFNANHLLFCCIC